MADIVLNAVKFLEREGNKGSGHNLKLRHNAVVIAALVCRAFPCEERGGIFVQELPRRYRVVYNLNNCWRSLELIEELVKGGRPMRCQTLEYVIPDGIGAEHLSVEGMPLGAARRLADDVADGWIDEVQKCIAANYSSEAAENFRQVLGSIFRPIVAA